MDWIIPLIIGGVVALVYLLKRSSFVSADAAHKYLRQGALVIDVRSVGEFRSGHLLQAMNIPLDELPDKFPSRVPDKNKIVLLHCLSGGRSALAQRQLRSMGYANVFNLGSLVRARQIAEAARQD